MITAKMASTPSGRSHCSANRQRQAAVMVCVLVVLFIVGLLMAQTVQTLLLVRRGDEARQSLRQARELVALGELILQQQAGDALPAEQTVWLVTDQAGSSSALDSTASVSEHRTEGHGQSARIAFRRIEDKDSAQRQTQITVTYRPGTPAEITATHIVADKETNDATTQ